MNKQKLWSWEKIHKIETEEASKKRLEETVGGIWIPLMVRYLKEDP